MISHKLLSHICLLIYFCSANRSLIQDLQLLNAHQLTLQHSFNFGHHWLHACLSIRLVITLTTIFLIVQSPCFGCSKTLFQQSIHIIIKVILKETSSDTILLGLPTSLFPCQNKADIFDRHFHTERNQKFPMIPVKRLKNKKISL